MINYIQISFSNCNSEIRDLLIAELSEAGYEGFEEKETGLVSFILEENFDEAVLKPYAEQYDLTWTKELIPPTNWNELWESNFSPVIVDDFCAIRAEFHEPVINVEYEIIITPKQSFGTGHHATTFMMIQQMRDIDFTGKKVFDFGTGTGILAILAEKSGSQDILAIDNDDWSMENSFENIERNGCKRVRLEKSEIVPENSHFDIILANINKNVITQNIVSLINSLTSKGIILISGLLASDREEIVLNIEKTGLKLENCLEKNNWICLKFRKL